MAQSVYVCGERVHCSFYIVIALPLQYHIAAYRLYGVRYTTLFMIHNNFDEKWKCTCACITTHSNTNTHSHKEHRTRVRATEKEQETMGHICLPKCEHTCIPKEDKFLPASLAFHANFKSLFHLDENAFKLSHSTKLQFWMKLSKNTEKTTSELIWMFSYFQFNSCSFICAFEWITTKSSEWSKYYSRCGFSFM